MTPEQPPEQPANDLVTRPDGTPEVLEAPTHPYRGYLTPHFLESYVEHHGQEGPAGLIDEGDDAIRTHGIELIGQLWPSLEVVLPGNLVPPQQTRHADSTDLVFSHDACGSPGVMNDRWAGVLSPKKYFVVFASHPSADDPLLVVCRDGQARPRKGLWELRETVEHALAGAGGEIAFTCCNPRNHPPVQ